MSQASSPSYGLDDIWKSPPGNYGGRQYWREEQGPTSSPTWKPTQSSSSKVPSPTVKQSSALNKMKESVSHLDSEISDIGEQVSKINQMLDSGRAKIPADDSLSDRLAKTTMKNIESDKAAVDRILTTLHDSHAYSPLIDAPSIHVRNHKVRAPEVKSPQFSSRSPISRLSPYLSEQASENNKKVRVRYNPRIIGRYTPSMSPPVISSYNPQMGPKRTTYKSVPVAPTVIPSTATSYQRVSATAYKAVPINAYQAVPVNPVYYSSKTSASVQTPSHVSGSSLDASSPRGIQATTTNLYSPRYVGLQSSPTVGSTNGLVCGGIGFSRSFSNGSFLGSNINTRATSPNRFSNIRMPANTILNIDAQGNVHGVRTLSPSGTRFTPAHSKEPSNTQETAKEPNNAQHTKNKHLATSTRENSTDVSGGRAGVLTTSILRSTPSKPSIVPPLKLDGIPLKLDRILSVPPRPPSIVPSPTVAVASLMSSTVLQTTIPRGQLQESLFHSPANGERCPEPVLCLIPRSIDASEEEVVSDTRGYQAFPFEPYRSSQASIFEPSGASQANSLVLNNNSTAVASISAATNTSGKFPLQPSAGVDPFAVLHKKLQDPDHRERFRRPDSDVGFRKSVIEERKPVTEQRKSVTDFENREGLDESPERRDQTVQVPTPGADNERIVELAMNESGIWDGLSSIKKEVIRARKSMEEQLTPGRRMSRENIDTNGISRKNVDAMAIDGRTLQKRILSKEISDEFIIEGKTRLMSKAKVEKLVIDEMSPDKRLSTEASQRVTIDEKSPEGRMSEEARERVMIDGTTPQKRITSKEIAENFVMAGEQRHHPSHQSQEGMAETYLEPGLEDPESYIDSCGALQTRTVQPMDKHSTHDIFQSHIAKHNLVSHDKVVELIKDAVATSRPAVENVLNSVEEAVSQLERKMETFKQRTSIELREEMASQMRRTALEEERRAALEASERRYAFKEELRQTQYMHLAKKLGMPMHTKNHRAQKMQDLYQRIQQMQGMQQPAEAVEHSGQEGQGVTGNWEKELRVPRESAAMNDSMDYQDEPAERQSFGYECSDDVAGMLRNQRAPSSNAVPQMSADPRMSCAEMNAVPRISAAEDSSLKAPEFREGNSLLPQISNDDAAHHASCWHTADVTHADDSANLERIMNLYSRMHSRLEGSASAVEVGSPADDHHGHGNLRASLQSSKSALGGTNRAVNPQVEGSVQDFSRHGHGIRDHGHGTRNHGQGSGDQGSRSHGIPRVQRKLKDFKHGSPGCQYRGLGEYDSIQTYKSQDSADGTVANPSASALPGSPVPRSGLGGHIGRPTATLPIKPNWSTRNENKSMNRDFASPGSINGTCFGMFGSRLRGSSMDNPDIGSSMVENDIQKTRQRDLVSIQQDPALHALLSQQYRLLHEMQRDLLERKLAQKKKGAKTRKAEELIRQTQDLISAYERFRVASNSSSKSRSGKATSLQQPQSHTYRSELRPQVAPAQGKSQQQQFSQGVDDRQYAADPIVIIGSPVLDGRGRTNGAARTNGVQSRSKISPAMSVKQELKSRLQTSPKGTDPVEIMTQIISEVIGPLLRLSATSSKGSSFRSESKVSKVVRESPRRGGSPQQGRAPSPQQASPRQTNWRLQGSPRQDRNFSPSAPLLAPNYSRGTERSEIQCNNSLYSSIPDEESSAERRKGKAKVSPNRHGDMVKRILSPVSPDTGGHIERIRPYSATTTSATKVLPASTRKGQRTQSESRGAREKRDSKKVRPRSVSRRKLLRILRVQEALVSPTVVSQREGPHKSRSDAILVRELPALPPQETDRYVEQVERARKEYLRKKALEKGGTPPIVSAACGTITNLGSGVTKNISSSTNPDSAANNTSVANTTSLPEKRRKKISKSTRYGAAMDAILSKPEVGSSMEKSYRKPADSALDVSSDEPTSVSTQQCNPGPGRMVGNKTVRGNNSALGSKSTATSKKVKGKGKKAGASPKKASKKSKEWELADFIGPTTVSVESVNLGGPVTKELEILRSPPAPLSDYYTKRVEIRATKQQEKRHPMSTDIEALRRSTIDGSELRKKEQFINAATGETRPGDGEIRSDDDPGWRLNSLFIVPESAEDTDLMRMIEGIKNGDNTRKTDVDKLKVDEVGATRKIEEVDSITNKKISYLSSTKENVGNSTKKTDSDTTKKTDSGTTKKIANLNNSNQLNAFDELSKGLSESADVNKDTSESSWNPDDASVQPAESELAQETGVSVAPKKVSLTKKSLPDENALQQRFSQIKNDV